MTFVSYAQNCEDVMLWRALKHIENGFYIDVGANDPEVDSVTKAFYDLGWHGINIEPLKSHYEDLCSVRTRDINLWRAAGNQDGYIQIWECDVRGWATASAEAVAAHEANGHVGSYHEVAVSTLKDICALYAQQDIHFLKIDVEGFEKEVIDGMDFAQYRPWIVVVESTKPNSTDESHFQWEEILTKSRYLYAYADGLNRFYVAAERAELLISLRYPPNTFDGFLLSSQVRSEVKARHLEIELLSCSEQLRQIQSSWSWLVTAPLRHMATFYFHLVAALRSAPRKILYYAVEAAQRPLSLLMGAVLRRPALSARINQLLMKYPPLYQHLVSVAGKQGLLAGAMGPASLRRSQPQVPPTLERLPSHARQIYADLKGAIENKHGVR